MTGRKSIKMATLWLVRPLLVAGIVAAILAPATAQEDDNGLSIEAIVTEAIRPAARLERVDTAHAGSASFRAALELVETGDASAAFLAARDLADPLERRTAQWAAIRFGKGKVDYHLVSQFAAEAPEYEFASTYKMRLEQSLIGSDASSKQIIAALGGQMPVLLDAQIALAGAYLADGQKDRAERIARTIWIENFLDSGSEKQVLDALGGLLRQSDYWDRAVHLLMHDRASAAERIMSQLTAAQKSLASARIAVSRKSGNAQSLIDKVDPSLRDHPLFWFARAQLARDKGALSTAVEMLDHVQGNPPDAAEFWYERRLISRRALAEGKPELAYAAAATYTEGPEGRVVDAQFHAGWIALSFLKKPADAVQHFKAMIAQSTLPNSVTQARYWLGRALDATGAKAEAKASYEIAARFDDLYYGQLAREALKTTIVQVRALPEWRSMEAAFEAKELVRAIRLLSANGQNQMAESLTRRLAYSISEPGEFVQAARLAQEIDAHHLAILIADIADRKGIPLDLFHFPKDGIPDGTQLAGVENAAVYAIARQESRFDVDAISRSGARGLMQLMPGTAKDVAKKLGISYSPSRLTDDPKYNLLLGSTYLATQISRYDGSLPLAAAAYNAGPGNVDKWIATFGDPRSADVDPVVWIEAIPFAETRKYVQHVMANYIVYRTRLGRPATSMAQVLRRLPG